MKHLLIGALLLLLGGGNSFAQCSQFPVLDLGPDTVLCNGQTITYTVPSGYDYHSWSVSPGNQADVTIATPTTLILNVLNYTGNLVVNGDFESGNTGFTSGYAVGNSTNPGGILWDAGTYAVTTDPHLVHSNFYSCSDVGTAAPGNMLVVNGSNVPNTIVWEQNITVVPNTDYDFSAWVMSVENISASDVASLQFFIDGVQIGAVFSPTLIACDWQQFNQLWNSGSATTATISIVAQVSSGNNDFAIDNISFQSACTQSDTVVIAYDTSHIEAGPNVTFCENEIGQLTATANFQNPQFTWNTGATTASITPGSTAEYYVTATSPFGCPLVDSVHATIIPMPWDFDTVVAGPTNCGENNGYVYVLMDGTFVGQPIYTWTGPGPNSPNFMNASVWQNLSTGWYYIDVESQGCHRNDSILVEPLNPPVAGVTANPTSGTYPLTVDFTNTSQNATSYEWYFGNGNSTTATDLSGQQQTYDTSGVYTVYLIASQGSCTDTITVEIDVYDPVPPPVTVPVDIKAPNIFTPNGDNINDVFEFELLNIAKIHTVISNRWGNVMLETDDNPVKWDGKDASDGVYFYKYEATGAQGEKLEGVGFVQLIR